MSSRPPSRIPSSLSSGRSTPLQDEPSRPKGTIRRSARTASGTIPTRQRIDSMSTSSAPFSAPLNAKNSEEEAKVQVVVRCRGRSPNEIIANSPIAITTSGGRGTTVTVSPSLVNAASTSTYVAPHANKTWTFDHVFGPECEQIEIYDNVARPLLKEVMMGYNATIFCYGQTGTGKTYTMEGTLPDDLLAAASETSFMFPSTAFDNSTVPDAAGIIPRTLHDLFEFLEAGKSEFTVRVSYVELYNEELRDLNATDSDRAKPESLRIYEDPKKGGGVVISGLEETLISSAAEGLKVLQRGSSFRVQAATKCNEQSSRSHSVFSITVHLKDSSSTGEDLLRVGKLNLVDLAGSENVGRSGAEKGVRAREAGMINQSLLTLGRVINALVASGGIKTGAGVHIPYRESKLTRLLQDSLGGKTKTCIIATISPVKSNLEETLSTLDYALRAKSIKNKPEVNQRMTKGALLNQYACEIERLKGDLLAAREKNGIFLSPETWNEFNSEREQQRVLLDEARRHSDALQSQLDRTTTLLRTKADEANHLDKVFKNQNVEIERLKRNIITLREERNSMSKRGNEWKQKALSQRETNQALWEKIERKSHIASSSSEALSGVKSSFLGLVQELNDQLQGFRLVQSEFVQHALTNLSTVVRKVQNMEDDAKLYGDESKVESLVASARCHLDNMTDNLDSIKRNFEEKAASSHLPRSLSSFSSTSLQELNTDITSVIHLVQTCKAAFDQVLTAMQVAVTNSSLHVQSNLKELDSLRDLERQSLADDQASFSEYRRLLQNQRDASAKARSQLRARIVEAWEQFELEERSAPMFVTLEESFDRSNERREWYTQQRFSAFDSLSEEMDDTLGVLSGGEAFVQQRKEADRVTTQASQALELALKDHHDRRSEMILKLQNEFADQQSQIRQLHDTWALTLQSGRQEMDRTTLALASEYKRLKELVLQNSASTSFSLISTSKTSMEQSQEYSQVAEQFLSEANRHVQELSSRLSNELENIKLQDVSTGDTPRKRKWSPALSDATDEDEHVSLQYVEYSEELKMDESGGSGSSDRTLKSADDTPRQRHLLRGLDNHVL